MNGVRVFYESTDARRYALRRAYKMPEALGEGRAGPSTHVTPLKVATRGTFKRSGVSYIIRGSRACYTHSRLMAVEIHRQNFNVDPDQAAALEAARVSLGAGTTKDAVLRAVRLVNLLAKELSSGKRLVSIDAHGENTRILLPDLEGNANWTYLCERPHPWRRQLSVKGRKLLASTLWNDAQANGMTAEEIAEDRDLPVEAVQEALRYAESHLPLVRMEAEEERRRLLASGIDLGA